MKSSVFEIYERDSSHNYGRMPCCIDPLHLLTRGKKLHVNYVIKECEGIHMFSGLFQFAFQMSCMQLSLYLLRNLESDLDTTRLGNEQHDKKSRVVEDC